MTHEELVEKVAIAVLASECAPVTWEELPNHLKNERRIAAREAIRIVGEVCAEECDGFVSASEKVIKQEQSKVVPASVRCTSAVLANDIRTLTNPEGNKT